jgi:hypothetical protein
MKFKKCSGFNFDDMSEIIGISPIMMKKKTSTLTPKIYTLIVTPQNQTLNPKFHT